MRHIEHQIVDGRELKWCWDCGVWFELRCFNKNQKRADGFSDRCKECSAKCSREWIDKNPEKYKQKSVRWKANNPERWRELNKLHAKIRRIRNPEYCQKYDRRFNSTPQRRLHQTISARIRETLCNAKFGRVPKSGRPWNTLVGYDSNDLVKYVESRLQPGFTWDNYGTVWELDHIIPVAAHKFTSADDEDFKRCWSLSNLNPIPKTENRMKSSKLDWKFQPRFSM